MTPRQLSKIQFARLQGYVRGLRLAQTLTIESRNIEKRKYRETKSPEDTDLHAEHDHAIKVLQEVEEKIVSVIRRAKQ